MTDVNRIDTAHPSAVAVASTESQVVARTSEGASEELRSAELTQRFLAIIGQSDSLAQIRAQLCELTCEMINAREVSWCVDDGVGDEESHDPGAMDSDVGQSQQADPREKTEAADAGSGQDQGLPMVWQALGRRAIQQGRTLIEAVEEDGKCTDVAIPCRGHGVLLCRLVSPSTMLPTFVALLKMAAGYFVLAETFHKQSGGLALAVQAQTRARLIEHLFRAPSSRESISGWCDHLASIADGSLIMLCLSRSAKSRCRLVSHSGTTEFECRGDVGRLANRLAEESRIAGGGQEDVLSSYTSFKSRTAVSLANLLGVDSVLAIPIADGMGQARGAVVVAGKHLNGSQRSGLDQTVMGTVPALLFRLNPAATQEKQVGTGPLKKIFAGGLTLIALAGLMAVPVPYRFHCGLVLEPTVRRVVAAPFDAVLTSATVRTGELVGKGEVIGKLDDRALKLERSQSLTERVRVTKQHEVFIAKGQVAEAQLSELRIQELDARLSLLDDRIAQSTLVAPISGVVISEDLEDVQDSPVELGQPLYEIAPLDSLRAQVEVPDYHANLVKSGQEVKLWVDDGTGKHLDGQLSRIAPSVEVRGAENVLLCEMIVPNQENSLRPGMDGTATIKAGTKPVGWVLFHRLINRLRVYVGV